MTHHDVDDEGVERTLVALADAPPMSARSAA